MIFPMMGAMALSLGIVLAMGPGLIKYLKKLHFGQTIYKLGPAHQQKQGTPVMGGLMMAAGVTVCTLLFHPYSWNGGWDPAFGLLAVSLFSMAVGFADDWIKAVRKKHEGLTPWQKIAGQVLIGAAFSLYCYFHPMIGSRIRIPFTGKEWDLGLFYLPLMTLLILFYVNSANLQDGLDGLLSTITRISSSGWAIIALLGAATLGWDRGISGVTGVFMISLAGACMGFLRFNRYPAKIFMGDTGSMLIGGGTVGAALMLRQPLLLLLLGFCPIMSSISVIMQRYYFKLTHGKRIFLMSPIHHHFEKKGYSETQIVSMYANITTVLTLIGILSLCVGLL